MGNMRTSELDKLFLEIGTYRKSTEFKELFEFMKKFPYIAPYNAMLIHVQKPGSEFVASAAEWNRRFNRKIKAGARPLVILRPFGPVAFVFELGDTYGTGPFPEYLLNPFKAIGQVAERNYKQLVDNLRSDGILCSEVEHGTASAGFVSINKSKQEERILRGRKEIWVKILYNMVVNKTHPLETKFATILHELGHIYCGHLGTPDPKWKGWEDRRHLELNQIEFEAESVCWLICERQGIENPSAAYLSGYLDNNEKIPDISIDTVLKVTGIIESMIDGVREPRKEIITFVKDLK